MRLRLDPASERARRARPAAPAGRPQPSVLDPGFRSAGTSCACGGGCPSCAHGSGAISLRGELQAPSATARDVESPGPSVPADPLGTTTCPVDALFLSNAAGGNSKVNCQVPSGLYGAARLAQYRVSGVSPIPTGGLTVTERFTAIDDPHSLASKLTPNSMITDANGMFDDCYSLFSPNALPPDFVLKVEQNHLYQGQTISKNVITYRSGSVDVRHCRRLPGSCDFSKRCGLA